MGWLLGGALTLAVVALVVLLALEAREQRRLKRQAREWTPDDTNWDA